MGGSTVLANSYFAIWYDFAQVQWHGSDSWKNVWDLEQTTGIANPRSPLERAAPARHNGCGISPNGVRSAADGRLRVPVVT